MKIGTFVMGGLAGAAVVMMIRRSRTMSAVAESMGKNMRHRMSGMKEDMISKALNMKFGSSSKRARTDADHHDHDSSHSFRSDALSQVKQLAAKDAEVSKEINHILEQNGQHQI